MTTIRVDAATIAALGGGIRDLADLLTELDDAAGLADAFGGTLAAGTFTDVVLGWRHERLALARELGVVAELTQAAGAAYLEVETELTSALDGLAGPGVSR